jgi:hypothetical protein
MLHTLRLRYQEAPKGTAPAPNEPVSSRDAAEGSGTRPDQRRNTAVVLFGESDPLPYTMPRAHYHISETTRHAENITAWLARNQGDCATIVSLNSLYVHHLLIYHW